MQLETQPSSWVLVAWLAEEVRQDVFSNCDHYWLHDSTLVLARPPVNIFSDMFSRAFAVMASTRLRSQLLFALNTYGTEVSCNGPGFIMNLVFAKITPFKSVFS